MNGYSCINSFQLVAIMISATVDTYSCTCTYICDTLHRNAIAGSQAVPVLNVIAEYLIALQNGGTNGLASLQWMRVPPVPTPLSIGATFKSNWSLTRDTKPPKGCLISKTEMGGFYREAHEWRMTHKCKQCYQQNSHTNLHNNSEPWLLGMGGSLSHTSHSIRVTPWSY